MAVITRNRAHETDHVLLTPRPRRINTTEQQQINDALTHHVQTRIASGHYLLGRNPQQIGEHLAQFAQPLQAAVVSYVGSVGSLGRSRQPQQLVGQVQLFRRGLAPGQIQLESARLEVGVVLQRLRSQGGDLIGTLVSQRLHIHGARLPATELRVAPASSDAEGPPSSRRAFGLVQSQTLRPDHQSASHAEPGAPRPRRATRPRHQHHRPVPTRRRLMSTTLPRQPPPRPPWPRPAA